MPGYKRINILKPKLNENPHWYVVKTNPQTEKKVYERLLLNDFNVFLPLYSVVRQWSDRKKTISLPLIPSVIFINCTSDDLSKLYLIPGTNGILNYLGKPAVVQDYEIENLQILLKEWDGVVSKESCTECLNDGVSVEVVRGPFKGLIATSITMNGNHRVIVEIDALGSNFVVNIPRSFLKKLNKVAA
ncbi:MAG: hypothetical protein RI883_976 [Bacteroidota bacterium]|jgi:transcription antitermination factor NusG